MPSPDAPRPTPRDASQPNFDRYAWPKRDASARTLEGLGYKEVRRTVCPGEVARIRWDPLLHLATCKTHRTFVSSDGSLIIIKY